MQQLVVCYAFNFDVLAHLSNCVFRCAESRRACLWSTVSPCFLRLSFFRLPQPFVNELALPCSLHSLLYFRFASPSMLTKVRLAATLFWRTTLSLVRLLPHVHPGLRILQLPGHLCHNLLSLRFWIVVIHVLTCRNHRQGECLPFV